MHRLADKDTEARTAICSECGPVKIYKNGNSFVCATAKKGRMREWAVRNPDAAKLNRRGKSAHVVTEGVCSLCGPTEVVPYGRGWACAGSPAAARRGMQQDAPQAKCAVCGKYPTGALSWEGLCPGCEADLTLQITALLDDDRPSTARWDEPKAPTLEWDGYSITNGDADPYELDDYQAVPGWRTIGSTVPWSEA